MIATERGYQPQEQLNDGNYVTVTLIPSRTSITAR